MSISPFGTFHFALTVVSCHCYYRDSRRATHSRGYPAGKASRTRKRVRTCAEIAFLWLFLSLARLASGTAFRACDSNLSQVLLDPRTGYAGPADYVVLKESYSYMLESAISTNKFLQKNIFTHFFFPDSHNRRGESGLGGRRHGRNVSDVDELRVLADRRPELHCKNRFAGHPRAAAIGKEHPAMTRVVNVGGRTAKQNAQMRFFERAGDRQRKKN